MPLSSKAADDYVRKWNCTYQSHGGVTVWLQALWVETQSRDCWGKPARCGSCSSPRPQDAPPSVNIEIGFFRKTQQFTCWKRLTLLTSYCHTERYTELVIFLREKKKKVAYGETWTNCLSSIRGYGSIDKLHLNHFSFFKMQSIS